MSLNQLTSGTPDSKPWLNISANTVNANTISTDILNIATAIVADGLTGDPNIALDAPTGVITADSQGDTTITSANGKVALVSETSVAANAITLETLAGGVDISSAKAVYVNGQDSITLATNAGPINVVSTGGIVNVAADTNLTCYAITGNVITSAAGTAQLLSVDSNFISSASNHVELSTVASTDTDAITIDSNNGGMRLNSAKQVYLTTADNFLVEATKDVYLEAADTTATAATLIATHGGVQIQSNDFETKIQSNDADITLQAVYTTTGGDINIESGNDSANTITLYAPTGKILLQPGQATVSSTNLQFDTVGYGIAGKFASATVVANACTCNSYFGVITDSGVVAPGNRTAITVTNSACTADSLILLQYDAVTAAPNHSPLSVSAVSSPGSFDLRVNNNSASATSAAPIYRFQVINAT